MSYNCSSGNFSSSSLSSCLRYPITFCGSSSPSNLVYRTGLYSPNTCQLGATLCKDSQEANCESSSCQTSSVASSPCQASCYHQRTSTLSSPCQTTYIGSLGFSSRSCHPLAYGSRSCYSLSCGPSVFRPLAYGVCGFPSLGYGSRFCYPTYFPFRNLQSSCYQPMYRYAFY
ncbi:keratin-associated protein 13-1-like [Rhynchocyon petersi]